MAVLTRDPVLRDVNLVVKCNGLLRGLHLSRADPGEANKHGSNEGEAQEEARKAMIHEENLRFGNKGLPGWSGGMRAPEFPFRALRKTGNHKAVDKTRETIKVKKNLASPNSDSGSRVQFPLPPASPQLD